MMDLFQSLSGMVTTELTSADFAGVMTTFGVNNILVRSVERPDELTARFQIRRRDFTKARNLILKRGEDLRILHWDGIYWDLKKFLGRPVLIGTILLLLMMTLILPGRVLFVEVEGNESIPARQILEAAEASGIRFWASRREVRSEKMKNALLAAVPQLQWAGVNTHGCVAVISVRERSLEETSGEETGVSSIAADRDGIILSVTVSRGNGLCAPGQAVKTGDILISGYTDCGLCVTATRAEGEILAATSRSLVVKTPAFRQIRLSVGELKTNFTLIIGKKRINFAQGSGIYDASCVKMYSKYVLSLPGGFQLPVILEKETIQPCPVAEEEISEEESEQLLKTFAQSYWSSQMISGTITHRLESVTEENAAWCLTGVYTCREIIGVRVQEQIGVVP